MGLSWVRAPADEPIDAVQSDTGDLGTYTCKVFDSRMLLLDVAGRRHVSVDQTQSMSRVGGHGTAHLRGGKSERSTCQQRHLVRKSIHTYAWRHRFRLTFTAASEDHLEIVVVQFADAVRAATSALAHHCSSSPSGFIKNGCSERFNQNSGSNSCSPYVSHVLSSSSLHRRGCCPAASAGGCISV